MLNKVQQCSSLDIDQQSIPAPVYFFELLYFIGVRVRVYIAPAVAAHKNDATDGGPNNIVKYITLTSIYLLQLLLGSELRSPAALLLAAVGSLRGKARVALAAHLLLRVILLGERRERGAR